MLGCSRAPVDSDAGPTIVRCTRTTGSRSAFDRFSTLYPAGGAQGPYTYRFLDEVWFGSRPTPRRRTVTFGLRLIGHGPMPARRRWRPRKTGYPQRPHRMRPTGKRRPPARWAPRAWRRRVDRHRRPAGRGHLVAPIPAGELHTESTRTTASPPPANLRPIAFERMRCTCRDGVRLRARHHVGKHAGATSRFARRQIRGPRHLRTRAPAISSK